MKKIIKKIIAIIISSVLLIGSMPVANTVLSGETDTYTVEASSQGGVYKKLISLKQKFPDGKYWNHIVPASEAGVNCSNEAYADSVTDTPCKIHGDNVGAGEYDCSYFDGGLQCLGFARKVFYDVFGIRESTLHAQRINGYSGLSVGDFVSFSGFEHYAVVLSINGSSFSVAECNLDGYGSQYNCIIRWGREYPLSKVGYYVHATNYDSIDRLCTEHKWDKGKVTKKTKHTKTELIDGEKIYTCTVCGETKTEVIKASHDFKTTKTTAATPEKNGSVKKKCDICGKTKTTTIYRPKPIKVKESAVVYTGKSLKPEVVVKDVKGKKILKQYYTVSYKNNRKLGVATAIVKFRGKYSGSKSVSFKIVPKAAKLIDCTGGRKSIKVKWKRVKGIDGYQIQYSKKKSFSNSKTVTVNKSKSLSRTIKKLSAGTTYYVRVRTYKTEKNKKYYSSWSNVMSAKTKAATTAGYVEITKSPVKAGSYYYKQNGWNILRSTKKTSGYTTILEPDTYFYQYVYTNGTYLYTVEETNTSADDEAYYLVRYSASGKNRKVVKKLPHDPDDTLGFWWIAASRGQKLILTHGENFRLFTYVYDVKAGKLTKVLNDRAIMDTVSGKYKGSSYVICEHHMDTAGLVASAKSLYKINTDGKMTLIMNLGDNVDAAFIGNKLYYVKFVYDFNEYEGDIDVYIYSCKADGTGKTLIHSYTDYYENGCVLRAGNFTSNTCDIYNDNSVAHVNYADGTIEWEYPDYY